MSDIILEMKRYEYNNYGMNEKKIWTKKQFFS